MIEIKFTEVVEKELFPIQNEIDSKFLNNYKTELIDEWNLTINKELKDKTISTCRYMWHIEAKKRIGEN